MLFVWLTGSISSLCWGPCLWKFSYGTGSLQTVGKYAATHPIGGRPHRTSLNGTVTARWTDARYSRHHGRYWFRRMLVTERWGYHSGDFSQMENFTNSLNFFFWFVNKISGLNSQCLKKFIIIIIKLFLLLLVAVWHEATTLCWLDISNISRQFCKFRKPGASIYLCKWHPQETCWCGYCSHKELWGKRIIENSL